jgi:hypothetical protein
MRGTASDVVGIDSATRFKKTVNDRRIVTPVNVNFFFGCFVEYINKKRRRKEIYSIKKNVKTKKKLL